MADQVTCDTVLTEVWEELARATDKFPFWPIDIIHASAIVVEEAGELMRASLQCVYESGDRENARKQAIQTAAMAIRFLLNLPKESPSGGR